MKDGRRVKGAWNVKVVMVVVGDVEKLSDGGCDRYRKTSCSSSPFFSLSWMCGSPTPYQ